MEVITQDDGSDDNCLDRGTPTPTQIVATELNSAKWRNLFSGPMQTFADADEFKKTLYKLQTSLSIYICETARAECQCTVK